MKNSFPKKADVIIVGAGPAGSTLAYHLAKAGVDVVLIDKATFPRGKTCGGGLNVRTQKLIPFDLSPVIEATITGFSFTFRFEEPFTRRYPEPLMYTVTRETFDHFLVQQAERAGAKFFDHTPFLSIQIKDGYTENETPAGICSAKYVVGADGIQGGLSKKMGLMPETSSMVAIHSEVPKSLFPHWEPDTVQVDWGSVKRTYAYLFPKKDHVSLGAEGNGASTLKIKNYHRAFLATQWRKEEALPFGAVGFVIPLRKKRAPIQAGRCLLVGDAAGLADPLTGEGIYSAIRSSRVAASILQEALRGDWGSLTPYQEKIDQELMPELECSRLFREIFNLRPSYYHQKIASSDRWWNAMARVMRGEKTFLEAKRKLGVVGSLLLRMFR